MGETGTFEPVVISCALTGGSSAKADNPALPITPEEIAADAEAVWRAGAAIAHVHLRDAAGRPTADAAIARRVVDLIRDRCPIVIQLSTGVAIGTPYDERARLVEAGADMITLAVATLTLGRELMLNPPDKVRALAERARALGVKPEVELYDTTHVDLALQLRDEGLLADPILATLVVGKPGRLSSDPIVLAHTVRRLPEGAHWQLAALGPTHRRMTCLGVAMGGHARTGLEDCIGDDADPQPTNVSHVERVAALARILGRPIASADDVRRTLAAPAAA